MQGGIKFPENWLEVICKFSIIISFVTSQQTIIKKTDKHQSLRVEIENPRRTCYECMRPAVSCICKHTCPIETKTRFIILMHPKEYKKEKNGTGHMTKLQLENSEIIVGVDFTKNKRVNEILNDKSTSSFLLYPGEESFNLSVRDNSEMVTFLGDNAHIFILDATWACARKMLKLSQNLQELQRVSFDNKIQSKFIIKQQPEPLCLSTIESVFTVLNLLNKGNVEQCDTKHFLIPFEKMIEFQVECILKPDNKNYRSSAKGEILPKTKYKDKTQRSILFK